MCSVRFINKIPKCIWIIFAIIGVIAIVTISYFIIQSLNSHYEDDETVKEESTEKTKKDNEDFDLEISLRKHRANLEHQREIEKEKNKHRAMTIGIILPICLVITVLICGTIIAIYRKVGVTQPMQSQNQQRNGMEMNEARMTIPKARMEDFITLSNMGFDKKNIAENINKTSSLGQVVDNLMAIDNENAVKRDTNHENETINANIGDVKSADTEMIYLGTI